MLHFVENEKKNAKFSSIFLKMTHFGGST